MYKLKLKQKLNQARSHSELQNAITMGKAVVKTLNKLVEKQKLAQTAISTWGSEEEDSDLQVFFRKINDVQDEWFAIQAAFADKYDQFVIMWESILNEVKSLDPLNKSVVAAESRLEKKRKALEKAKGKPDFETKRAQLEGDVDEMEAQLEQALRERDTRSDEITAFKKERFAEGYTDLSKALLIMHERGSRAIAEQIDAAGRLDARYAAERGNTAANVPQLTSLTISPAAAAASSASSPRSAESEEPPTHLAQPVSHQLAAESDTNASGVESGDGAMTEPQRPPSTGIAASDGPVVESDGDAAGDDDDDDGIIPVQLRVRALYDYEGEEGDLSFRAGDIIDVTGKDEDGWWIGIQDGVEGLVPSNYVEVLEGE
ncbi:uncharacterized protein AMSG_01384 [Thecamonas trahens ATCC 50062]|uniref:SH3 domain-containing protein n=1 Tax=Thecamonas trahens ATCC 50062 TaxID=461836 RepID=A0A0L0DQI2_THETB|nr:hypothetical protein AMSG_01384 [Thecamonas trahens ATCC 50062]KNC53673.1 hypothetical protein AMSG_01384 [Thecamonas trahens ATCC 50062]|eukprot:XP_013761987.1 hypothetical protein AMSG_01384 [Thecamonas trahens ATCC 50062]